MPRIDSFLQLVVDQGASDLHFMAGSPPIIRHDGDLQPIPFRELNELETRQFLTELLTPEQRQKLEEDQELDFAYALEGVGRFRANLFLQRRGLGAVFRVIPEGVPTLGGLGLPSSLRRLLDFNNGLVLFTGPTGSGKTTTQAALLHEFNRTKKLHILTIEDPIEFMHEPLRSLVTQRQIGRDVGSFPEALRSALRESPDLLLVGEMRDLETVSLALSAAETGVLVFGTLHTGSAANAFDRIVDVFPEEQSEQVRGVLSVVVRAVVAQRLVRRSEGAGRVPAFEVLVNDVGFAHLIREGRTHQIDARLQALDPSSGMQSMDKSLLELMREGLISYQEALLNARYPQMFAGHARRLMGLDTDHVV